jgi:hypothetical protein
LLHARRSWLQHTYELIARHLCDRARERMRPWSRRYQGSRDIAQTDTKAVDA